MSTEPDHPHHTRPGASPYRPTGSPPTVLTMPRFDRWVMFVGLPVAGVVLSLLLPVLARWLLDLGTGLPIRPAFRFLGGIDNWWKALAAAAIGALAGLAAAATAATRTATVKVGDADLVIEVGGRRQTIVRADVDAVFLDGKNIVVQDTGSRRLFSTPLDAPGTRSRRLSASAATGGWRATRPSGSTGSGGPTVTSCPPTSTRCSPHVRRH